MSCVQNGVSRRIPNKGIIEAAVEINLKMGFSNLRDSGICAMNNFEFWRQISLLLFVVCF